MRTEHSDKSLTPDATKGLSAAGRAAYARATGNLGLTFDEANAVGHAVAVAADRASRGRWLDGMDQAAEPTEAETAELASCQAAHAAAVVKREAARTAVIDAERKARQARFEEDGRGRVDMNLLIRLDAAVHGAGNRFEIECQKVDVLDAALRRARVAIHVNGGWRQNLHLRRGV